MTTRGASVARSWTFLIGPAENRHGAQIFGDFGEEFIAKKILQS